MSAIERLLKSGGFHRIACDAPRCRNFIESGLSVPYDRLRRTAMQESLMAATGKPVTPWRCDATGDWCGKHR